MFSKFFAGKENAGSSYDITQDGKEEEKGGFFAKMKKKKEAREFGGDRQQQVPYNESAFEDAPRDVDGASSESDVTKPSEADVTKAQRSAPPAPKVQPARAAPKRPEEAGKVADGEDYEELTVGVQAQFATMPKDGQKQENVSSGDKNFADESPVDDGKDSSAFGGTSEVGVEVKENLYENNVEMQSSGFGDDFASQDMFAKMPEPKDKSVESSDSEVFICGV